METEDEKENPQKTLAKKILDASVYILARSRTGGANFVISNLLYEKYRNWVWIEVEEDEDL